jgi:hypothetical protein
MIMFNRQGLSSRVGFAVALACLLVVLVCGACSKQARPQVTVVVQGVGEYVLDDSEESRAALYHGLRDRYDTRTRSPVLIKPAYGTPEELVQKAIDICVANGFWECRVSDESGAGRQTVKDDS